MVDRLVNLKSGNYALICSCGFVEESVSLVHLTEILLKRLGERKRRNEESPLTIIRQVS